MKFLIRADASIHIGSGHIMRCLTLAHALRKQGHQCTFITRAHTGHLAELISEQGFECVLLPKCSGSLKTENEKQLAHSAWLGCTQAQDFADCEPYIRALSPDWLICDHYALSDIWQRQAKQLSGSNSQHTSANLKIMVIDDLHDRPHAADLLLDQNYGHTAQDYINWLPETCQVLAGTRYALLREEFAQWRESALNQDKNKLVLDPIMPTKIIDAVFPNQSTVASGCLKTVSASNNKEQETQNILINLGGVDKDNHTLAILQNLEKLHTPNRCDAQQASVNLNNVNLIIIMGKTAPHIASIQAFAETAPFACQVIVHAPNMAELMAQADWTIGAAGSTSWERCALGLPTLLLVIAENQREIAENLQAAGAAIALQCDDIHTEKFTQAVQIFRQPENLRQLSQKAAALCDGKGVNRVVNYLLQQHFSSLHSLIRCSVRPATMDDCQRIFDWRNHADIRKFMFNTDELIWAQHTAWFAKQINNPDFKILIYCENQQEKGYISFKKLHLTSNNMQEHTTEHALKQCNTWEWGFYTAPDAERGTGTRMAQTALTWAFNELNAQEIIGQVLAHNTTSLKLHEKMGFYRLPENKANQQIVDFKLTAEEFLY